MQNLQENNRARFSFLIKMQTLACKFIKKENLAQVYSCKLCTIFKSAFFIEHIRWLFLNIEQIQCLRGPAVPFELQFMKGTPTKIRDPK